MLMLDFLRVRDFRCFETAELRFDPGTTLLFGRNGQGKTSLLEAACVLLRLQSPRTSSRRELIRLEAETALVEGGVDDKAFRCVMKPGARRLAIDGVTCSRTGDYLAQSQRVVWMDHADMDLLRGGGDQRRRFIDFVASQIHPGYLKALRGYERALRGRNFVLKRDASIQWKEADAFADVMQEQANVLVQSRRELSEAMQEWVSRFHSEISLGNESATMTYVSSCEPEDLQETLRQRRDEEARSRSTVCGPHRDDLDLHLDQIDARIFASEGQQRSLSLAMKLAQARILELRSGTPPLILIDDVFGELDEHRRRALMEHLPDRAQKIITTTRIDWMGKAGVEGRQFRVEQGSVEHSDPP
jgi:DNA replication and repair protein RecF